MTEKTPLTTVIEGKSILTFYKDQNNLCCRKFETSTGSWAEQETLVQHFGQEYAATVGSKRNIHLVANSDDGNLHYLCWDGAHWSKSAHIATDSSSHKNIRLTTAGGNVHVMFLSNEDEDNAITYLYMDDSGWSKPFFIRTKDIPQRLSNVIVTGDGTPHFLCQEKNSASASILRHYLFYRQDSRFFLNTNDISSEQSDHDFQPYLCLDQKNIRLTYLDPQSRVLVNLYKLKGWPEEGWNKGQVLSPDGSKASSPILLTGNNRLSALWQQNESVYYCLSIKGSDTWGSIDEESDREKLLSILLNGHQLQLPYTVSASSPPLYLSLIQAAAEPFLAKLYPPKEDETEEIKMDVGMAHPPVKDYPAPGTGNAAWELIKQDNSKEKKQLEKLAAQDDRIKELESELDRTKKQLDELKFEIKNLSADINEKTIALASRNDAANSEQALTQKVAFLKQEVQNTKQQCKQLETNNAKNQSEIKAKMEAMKRQIKTLQSESLKTTAPAVKPEPTPPKKPLVKAQKKSGLLNKLRRGVKT